MEGGIFSMDDIYKDDEEITFDRAKDAQLVISGVNDNIHAFNPEYSKTFNSLIFQFSQMLENGSDDEEFNLEILTLFNEIARYLYFFPQNIFDNILNSTFFTDFDNFLYNNALNYQILAHIFQICYTLLKNAPQYTDIFNETQLFHIATDLLDIEFDEVSITAILLIDQMIKCSTKPKIFIDNIDLLLQKLFSAWKTCEQTVLATCEILHYIVCNLQYEDDDGEHIAEILESIMKEIRFYYMNLYTYTLIYDTMIHMLRKNEQIILKNDILIDCVFRDVNIFDVNQKNAEDVEEFCYSAISLTLLIRESANKDPKRVENLIINTPFLMFCIQTVQNSKTVEKALKFLKMDLDENNTELYDKYKKSDIIPNLLMLQDNQSFSIKKGIIQIIHGMLKHELLRDVYDHLVEFNFIQNYIFILEDENETNYILLFLEIIFMMTQFASEINDMNTLISILDECDGNAIIRHLTENENEDIMTHSHELIEIFWPN